LRSLFRRLFTFPRRVLTFRSFSSPRSAVPPLPRRFFPFLSFFPKISQKSRLFEIRPPPRFVFINEATRRRADFRVSFFPLTPKKAEPTPK
jgi:hypothetical protein